MVETWWQNDNDVQLLNCMSVNVKIFFQWVPLHVNLCGNEIADVWAREDSRKDSTHGGCLTFSEIATRIKQDISPFWRQAPVHELYERNRPFLGTGSRRNETTFAKTVDILELNGVMWRVLKFTLLVRIALLPKPLLPTSWLVLVAIRTLKSYSSSKHGFMDLI
ncbi:RNase H domain-containing protein [Trichonephila clavipes]|nr:RNase H domain-containing protein [Trichonephila clavipes]